jgi:hypothetical protein
MKRVAGSDPRIVPQQCADSESGPALNEKEPLLGVHVPRPQIFAPDNHHPGGKIDGSFFALSSSSFVVSATRSLNRMLSTSSAKSIGSTPHPPTASRPFTSIRRISSGGDPVGKYQISLMLLSAARCREATQPATSSLPVPEGWDGTGARCRRRRETSSSSSKNSTHSVSVKFSTSRATSVGFDVMPLYRAYRRREASESADAVGNREALLCSH